MDSNYLSFDLGGSGGKLMLGRFDGARLALEEVYRFDNEPIAINDCLYWDIFDIYRRMNFGIKRAFGLARGGIRSMGLDSFSNDHAFIDERGELLTPLRCYRDARTERLREAIYARMSPERLYALSGNQIAPFNTLMQLAAMREAGQGFILDKAHRLLFTPDLLIHFMTGEQASEYTIASVSQLFDFVRGDWSGEILDAFGIPRSLLCDIVQPGRKIGRTRETFNRAVGIPGLDLVSVCEHDTASAFLSAASRGARAIISSGTWSLVGTEVPAPIIEPLGFRCNIANEGGPPGKHRILRNVMGLWIVQELARQYRARGEGWDFAEMEAEAAAALPFSYRIDPDDPRFYSPDDMGAAIRLACQEADGRAPETRGETLRTVFEGLALKYRWALEKIEGLTGRSLDRVDLVGGGSKNALLCQFTANACGRPVLAGPAEATALGNILIQLLADGRIASIDEGRELIRSSFPISEYLPERSEEWNGIYAGWREHFSLG